MGADALDPTDRSKAGWESDAESRRKHEFEDPENRFEQRTGRRQWIAEVLGFIAQALDDLDLVLQASEPR